MNENQDGTITRNFGFNDIDWGIKNLCYEVIKEDFVIFSPEFYIDGGSTTKWKMKVCPKVKRNGSFVFSINLERLRYEPGPATVSVSSKVLIVNKNGEKCFATYHEGNFALNSCEISYYCVNFLLNHLKLHELESAEFRIHCCVIVKNDDCIQMTSERSDTGLGTLSDDLTNLWQTAADSDLTIKFHDGKEIFCHKAILNARTSKLCSFLEEYIFATDNSAFEILKNIISYIYSGNIDIIEKNASVRMYDCILLMKVRGMEDYFRSQSSCFHSEIDVDKFRFSWVVANPSVLCENGEIAVNCLHSECFEWKAIDSTWRLTLFLDDLNNSREYVSISANIVDGSVRGMCYVTFVLGDGKNVWSKKSKLTDGNNHIRCLDFISRDSFTAEIKNCDNLYVDFILDIYSYNVSLSKAFKIEDCDFPKGYFYNCLSDDLACMFERADQTDVFIEVEGTCIGVHKCILTARSPVLRSMIIERDNKYIINLNHMKKSVLQVVLNYIYTGKFQNCLEWEILDVYKAAKVFDLMDLKEKCSDKMKELLTLETVWGTLVFSYQQEDQNMKISVMKFIRDNSPEVFQNKCWDLLLRSDPGLCDEVADFLTQYRYK